MIPLGRILRRSQESIELDPANAYKQVTVRLFHRGVVLRSETPGAEIRTTSQWRVRPEQVLLSRIDARNGAIGLVPRELDGAIVTNDFWVFDIDTELALALYLDAYFGTAAFVAECTRASEGTTNRVRLQPGRFSDIEVPLPPLDEQWRIVARIEETAARLREANNLCQRALQEADKLRAAYEARVWPLDRLATAPTLEEVTAFLARGRHSQQGHSEHFLVKTQHVQLDRYVPTTLRLASDAAARVTPQARLQDGDILVACSAAGCLGRVARYVEDGRVASTDTHVAIARPKPEVVEPEYLYAYLSGAQGQHQLRSRERGDWQRQKVGFRLTELNLQDLKQVPVPLPSRDQQRLIVQEVTRFRMRFDQMIRLKNAMTGELAVLSRATLAQTFGLSSRS